MQSFVSASPTAPLVGIPIPSELFGASGLLSIAITEIAIDIIQIPIVVMLAELEVSQKLGTHFDFDRAFRSSLLKAIKTPVVIAPILTIVLVLLGGKVPSTIEKMLDSIESIGTVISGANLFFTRLMLSAYVLKLNEEVTFNCFFKSILQPLTIAGLVFLVRIPNPVVRTGIVICAISIGVVGVILASRDYRSDRLRQRYQSEAGLSLLLTATIVLVTLPIVLVLMNY